MGPRPLGRGWSSVICSMASARSFNGAATARSRMVLFSSSRCYPLGIASMGPRPLGRGWSLSSTTRATAIRRFNGAATARSRMDAYGLPVQYRDRSFNGAATARSRMDLAPAASESGVAWLQWGRDR